MQNWSVKLKNKLQQKNISQNQCKLLSLKNPKLANGNFYMVFSIEITSVRCNIFV